jgi:hypothetical protein
MKVYFISRRHGTEKDFLHCHRREKSHIQKYREIGDYHSGYNQYFKIMLRFTA